MKADAFRGLVASYERAKDRNLTTYCLLLFSDSGKSLSDTSGALSAKIRPNDYLGQDGSGDLAALLTNTDTEGAGIVISRFEKAGFPCRLVTKEELYHD